MRSWPVLLFLALVCIPPLALVILGPSPDPGAFRDAAWIFAAYFATAWLLLIGVIVRPAQVTRQLLILVVVIALVTQVPLALALETALHNNTTGLLGSVFTTGLPEELAKALPVAGVALLYRRQSLTPVDYLFLGAVSGLVFGASEVVHYFTLGASTGNEAEDIITYIWRFLTDPIGHACWAGLSGYFIGLAVTGRYEWYEVGWIGLAAASVLHGLNDWSAINGHFAWVLVVLVSAIAFLGFAKAGPAAQGTGQVAAAPPAATAMPPAAAAGSPAPPAAPWYQAQASRGSQPAPGPASPRPTPRAPAVYAESSQPTVTSAPVGPKRPWWEQ